MCWICLEKADNSSHFHTCVLCDLQLSRRFERYQVDGSISGNTIHSIGNMSSSYNLCLLLSIHDAIKDKITKHVG